MRMRFFMQVLSKIKDIAAKADKVKLCATGAAVVCAAALMITFAVNSSSDDESVDTQPAAQTTSAGEQTQQTQKLDIVQFRKAPLSDYDMAQTQVKTSGDKTEEKSEKKTDSADFTIAPEDKDFSYSDNMNSPARLFATRDTSSEFFTVRDITTGKLVTMNAHELVCGIVYNEVGDGWGAEAIKAQAVAAYSCLRYSDSIGMVETVGIKKNYTPIVESCVRAVEGQVVMYGSNIANTLYSASTAGYTIPSGDVIVSSYPYLRCVKSAYDDKDPNWGRKVNVSEEKVKSTLESKFGITLSDDLKNWFKITDSRYGKYIFKMSIDSQANTTGKIIAGLFGLRSNAFDIRYSGGTFTFTSYGWGHGVGMSQWGACMYAKKGYSYDQILTHYYVGTRVSLSNVSSKAVARGKKTPQELEEEAKTATQSTMDSEQTTTESLQVPDETTTTTAAQTSAETSLTEPPEPTSEQTSAPEKDPEGEKDEQGRAKYAGKVVKSA